MMYMGSKAYTKDLDLVVRGGEAYKEIHEAMIRMGFESIRPGSGYERMNLSDMLVHDDGVRVDLFDTRVCSRPELSESMIGRGVLRH